MAPIKWSCAALKAEICVPLVECDKCTRRPRLNRIPRSLAGYKFHAETYKTLMQKLKKRHGDVVVGSVIGGGRISRDPKLQMISVYGYSKTFGRCAGCNERSAGILRAQYPDYEVSWSDEGY